uniref:Uncharacterized protein n=1 Tax=Rhipicephalus pulchellus TaxID=72859 RepID=L7LVN2_RHIPC
MLNNTLLFDIYFCAFIILSNVLHTVMHICKHEFDSMLFMPLTVLVLYFASSLISSSCRHAVHVLYLMCIIWNIS